MAILGYDTLGANSISSAVGRKLSSKFTLGSAATLTELHCWFAGASQSIIVHIYTDSAGSPATRVAYTSVLSVNSPGTPADANQTGLSVALTAGDYWLGTTFNTGSGNFYCLNGAGTSKGKVSGAVFNPPSDPYGTIDYTGTEKFSAWAVVTAAGGPTGFLPGIVIT